MLLFVLTFNILFTKFMTVYIVDIESIDSRYTCEWKTHVPNLLSQYFDVQVVSGPDVLPRNEVPGAFLNFGATNYYKAAQVQELSLKFCNGEIANGDYFLFTDFWHPGVIQLKYMAELMNIDIKIGGLVHAGHFDPHDFLGRIKSEWIKTFEDTLFQVYDHLYFATDFVIDMFAKNAVCRHIETIKRLYPNKIVRTGWPMEYSTELLKPYVAMEKEQIILFPHRLAPEKQVDIFKDLEKRLPQYTWVACQENNLSKIEYHELLGRSKLTFSCSKQETYGIAMIEAVLAGSFPLVPNHLSYAEMYTNKFKYPAEWIINFDTYEQNADKLVDLIIDIMESDPAEYADSLKQQTEFLTTKYLHCSNLVATIRTAIS